MRSTKLPTIARSITTLTSRYIPITAAASVPLNSDCETSSHTSVYACNRAIDNEIKSGSLDSALKLFDGMPIRDVVTWNLLISGHGRYGQPKQALYLYTQMVSQGIKESGSTFSSLLSICSDAGFYQEGIQVHCRLIFLGFSMNIFVGSSLVGLYMYIGLVDSALKLFNDLSHRTLAAWNLVLRGFCELGRSNDLLGLYSEMKLKGVEPNGLTFCYLIRGCGNERLLDEGKQLHCCATKLGWLESNLFVANALVDFYSACGCLIGARKSVEVIPSEDVISWNSIVSVYAENGFSLNALDMFNRMQLWGKRPSVRAFLGFLGLSSGTPNLILGRQIHSCVIKLGFYCGSVHIHSALIDMYGKCGEIDNSVSLFEGVPERSLGCCNALMTSFLHGGIVEDVVEMFGLMLDEGIGFDEVSLSTTLKALSVSTSGSLASCTLVHCCAIKSGFESDIAVSCSLIDAYSRSGHVELSQQVFEKLPSPNVICYTSMISGYARNGMGRKCLETLDVMIQRGVKLDEVALLSVLKGCNHSGLVKEGRMVFDSIKSLHGLAPNQQHYSCLVDLLGRAGLLDEAEELLKQAPVKGRTVMWSSLLGSCRVHRNEMVGHRAAKILMGIEPENHVAWFQASKFYSEIGDFATSAHIRELAMARKMRKEIGLLVVAHGTAERNLFDDISILGELENLDVEEGGDIELFGVPSWASQHGSKVLVNVDGFGAVGDGVSDDTQAFVNAWNEACSTPKSVFLVPKGRCYLVNATRFRGPCANKLIVQIDGTIIAPDDPKKWDPKNPRIWLDFSNLTGVLFQGVGVIDGSGSKWWTASCKKNKSNAFTIDSSSAIRVKGLTIRNSQQMHFVVSQSQSVHLSDIEISAPGDSPNTDGIHITGSTNVVLQNCKIGTGDDCISIVNGSSNIKMKTLYCGPGHGISIGSLGKDNSTGIVTNVVLDTAFLRETTNGLRIKTWQGGSGYVRSVRYQNVRMQDVSNPIIIDQFYCDSPIACHNQTSAVAISEIMYRNISGTSTTEGAMKFACSDTVPCRYIVLNNINLDKKDGTVETYCNSATGFGYGYVQPSAECLTSVINLTKEFEDHIHTEL
ncbi:hypothetical protein U1Q18_017087 [Sarracenia purpurea var. burkii]